MGFRLEEYRPRREIDGASRKRERKEGRKKKTGKKRENTFAQKTRDDVHSKMRGANPETRGTSLDAYDTHALLRSESLYPRQRMLQYDS